ncbi:MAG: acyl-ACP thioesterase [Rhodobiaceae bacterium]|nr:acyl-ACP thioesterase [Rhodobiaceae bacterium]
MTQPVPTLQGTVNTWQCDEVGHMNVQFYFTAGADATRIYAAGLGAGEPISARTAHIRFHRELCAGDIFSVSTQMMGTGETGLILAHEIYNRGADTLAATIVSRTDLPTDLVSGPHGTLSEMARPRSISERSALPLLSLGDKMAADLIPIYQGLVHPNQCDTDGLMRQQFIMARFSDGAAHLWHHVGFDRETMLKARRGTVVLEMRLDRLADIRSGTVLVAKSAIVEVAGKVLRFAHFLFDGVSGDLLATGEAAAVLLDLDKRKTVAFSETERAGLTPFLMEM